MIAQPSAKITAQLFTTTEREICKKIAAKGNTLSNKRARLLLLIDEGHTQAQACEKSGMSIGQLRYALTLFRKNGLQMFPDQAPAPQPQSKPTPTAKESVKLLIQEVVEKMPLEKTAKKNKKEKPKTEKLEKKEKKKSKKNKKKDKSKKKKKNRAE